jgi:hypothetical protein
MMLASANPQAAQHTDVELRIDHRAIIETHAHSPAI